MSQNAEENAARNRLVWNTHVLPHLFDWRDPIDIFVPDIHMTTLGTSRQEISEAIGAITGGKVWDFDEEEQGVPGVRYKAQGHRRAAQVLNALVGHPPPATR